MTTKNAVLIKSTDELARLVEKIAASEKLLGFDVETGYSGPDRPKGSVMVDAGAFIVGFSFTVDPRWGCYVPLRHDTGPNLDEDKVWELMKPLLETRRIVAHNIKFEKRMLETVDIILPVSAEGSFCTMLELYTLQEVPEYGLKAAIKKLYGHQMTEIAELFPGYTEKQLECLRFNKLEVTPKVVSYACEDAIWVLPLHEKAGSRARTERPDIFRIEHEIADLMCEAEKRGTAVDWEGLASAQQECEPFLVRYEQEVKADFGALVGRSLEKLNFNSPHQMRALLFDPVEKGGLGIKPTRMTKGGKPRKDGKPPAPPAPSTDATAMKQLSKKYPAIKKLLEMREVDNLRKRFVKWMDSYRVWPDGRVHASYAQAVVPTGRFAASDPAIQQLPKEWRWALRGPWGDLMEDDIWEKVLAETEVHERFYGNFRDFIVAGEGHYFLGFDYSQIELRALAGLAQEKALLDAFEAGEDVHVMTAAMMLNKPKSAVTAYDRKTGKTMNFALIYGMGPGSLADRLAITMDEAKALYDAYFAAFPGVKSWMDRTQRTARQNRFTISALGRKCTIWEYFSKDRKVYAKGDRVAGNAPVQGWAADYMKVAMLRCRTVLRDAGLWGDPVMLVANLHDALTFEVQNHINPTELLRLLKPAVEFPMAGFPEIVTDWELGQKWGSGVPLFADSNVVFDSRYWHVIDEGGPAAEKDDFDLPEEDDEEIVTPEPGTTLEEALSEGVDKVVAAANLTEGHTIIIELADMPPEAGWRRFVGLLREHPGNNQVVIRTPEGDLPLDLGTSLEVLDQPRVSLVLGGARLYHPAEEVDTTALAADITL